MERRIKVGFCVAYDWALLKKALPFVYNDADVICLSIDRSRKSWRGQSYQFDEGQFKMFIEGIDVAGKIDVYEDDFYKEGLTAFECEGRQRSMIAKRMGVGGWHIQLDCDEYFFKFGSFVKFLINLNNHPTSHEKPFNVGVFLVDVIKRLDDGYLVANTPHQVFSMPLATTRPEYHMGRQNGHFNMIAPFYYIHETWARNPDELRYKLNNWGHSSQEFKDNSPMIESYLKIWSALDRNNAQFIKDFHFASPGYWRSLQFVPGNSVDELMLNYKFDVGLSKWKLFVTNSRFFARIRQLLGKFRIAR